MNYVLFGSLQEISKISADHSESQMWPAGCHLRLTGLDIQLSDSSAVHILVVLVTMLGNYLHNALFLMSWLVKTMHTSRFDVKVCSGRLLQILSMIL